VQSQDIYQDQRGLGTKIWRTDQNLDQISGKLYCLPKIWRTNHNLDTISGKIFCLPKIWRTNHNLDKISGKLYCLTKIWRTNQNLNKISGKLSGWKLSSQNMTHETEFRQNQWKSLLSSQNMAHETEFRQNQWQNFTVFKKYGAWNRIYTKSVKKLYCLPKIWRMKQNLDKISGKLYCLPKIWRTSEQNFKIFNKINLFSDSLLLWANITNPFYDSRSFSRSFTRKTSLNKLNLFTEIE